MNKLVNIIIPLGGIGSRFAKEGYQQPKPFIKAQGRSIIYRVLDGLHINKHKDSIHKVIIIYNYQLEEWKFRERLTNYWLTQGLPRNMLVLVKVPYNTGGAFETIYYGLSQIESTNLSYPVVSIDGDTVYTNDLLNHCRNQELIGCSGVICFKVTIEEPIYSYVKFTYNESLNKHLILDLAEKKVISSYANSGCYLFDSGTTILEYGQKWLAKGDESRVKGEFYTSAFLDYLKQFQKLYASIIDFKHIQVLGTPVQLRIFSDLAETQKQRICFDLDGTLVTPPVIPGDYRTVEGIDERINLCRFLKQQGHTIIIYTARRMRTWKGNQGKAVADIAKVTLDTLEKLQIPYDELYFGKPYAHVYIDDLACPAHQDLQKALGFYQTKVNQRVFHSIEYSYNTVVKSQVEGTRGSLAGELYWYRHCPTEFQKYIPRLLEGSANRLVLERIQGISLTNLLVNQTLSQTLLARVISILCQLHQLCSEEDKARFDQQLLYANYRQKISKRYRIYQQEIYVSIQRADRYYQVLMEELGKYEQQKMAKIGIIHGDPVLTNWLIDNQSQLKVIDMRGCLGDSLTILGDCLYDYAKLYQSLTGYDYILRDCPLTDDIKRYLSPLQKQLEKHIESIYGLGYIRYLKVICASLYFSLIPLHPESKKKHQLWADIAYELLADSESSGT